jgi:aspartyl/asparaginyl beta-hydroxylase (cupin superfamily)
MALVRLAELHERLGELGEAQRRWSGALAVGAHVEPRTPELNAVLARASAFVAAQTGAFAERLDRALSAKIAEAAPRDRRRFEACVDHMLGRRPIFTNQCAGLHYPFLPADEFFDREHFPWLPQIEQQTPAIRAELEGLLAEGQGSFAPYVSMEPGLPPNKWSGLDKSLDWSALHLWREGEKMEEACARAPVTAALVEGLPLAPIPGRAPTVFFSLLRPHARIPAHTGVSNIRAIIHLPLIVPEGCGFRVGGETRLWKEGEAFAFDDTIEHEAWNESDSLRAVLIFDVWNPHLSAAERMLLQDLFSAEAGASEAAPAALRSVSPAH